MNHSRRKTALARILVLAAGSVSFGQTPQFSAGITRGTIQNSAVTEASGIVASHLNANILWTHNDSGHPAQIFPMTPAGANLGTYTISGASNTDWEDIAIGPGPASGAQYIYIGDIGDNNAARSNIAVYRVPEPTVSTLQQPGNFTLSGAVKFTLVYPDGPRNAESMFVDPLTRDIYIITKFDQPKHVYRAAYPQSSSGTITLEAVGSFTTTSSWLTAADISPDGNEIIVRSTATTSGRMYIRPPGGTIADAFASPTPISIPLLAEAQGEAIGFDAQGWGYYTTTELNGTASAPIHYFDRLPPHAVWVTGSGNFGTALSWDIGAVPNANSSVHFGITASGIGLTYTVNFSGNLTNAVAIVHRDNVTWDLAGATYTLSGYSGVDSLVVGSSNGENAALNMEYGTLVTNAGAGGYSVIGRGVGAKGVVSIGTSGKWINSPPLLIGKLGSGTLNINTGGSATLSDVYLGGSTTAAGGSGALNISGGSASISGTLKAWNDGTIVWSSGSLSASSLQLSGGGKMYVSSGGNKVLRVSSLTVDSANAGKLDLSDNDMIVDYSGSSPLATIQSLIQAGYNGGSWTGDGITSSSAAAASLSAHKTALGYAEASALFGSFPATFSGQSVDSTSILIRYTLSGDANLDGTVDTLDFNSLAANFGSSINLWSAANFNYDGAIDTLDFNLLASNFALILPTATAAEGVIIPEPATLALLLLAPLIRRRARHRLNGAPA
jgi:T5SS/PEP-CTERM-associated repeat protein